MILEGPYREVGPGSYFPGIFIGQGETYVINTAMEKSKCMDINCESKEGCKSNPGNLMSCWFVTSQIILHP